MSHLIDKLRSSMFVNLQLNCVILICEKNCIVDNNDVGLYG